jgi:hypothetical protein
MRGKIMLTGDSIKWAVDMIKSQSDGDLFPRILEIDAISENVDEFVRNIVEKDLSQIQPGVCRRFIVPKDEYSYRQATQLDPQDSIILTSIIYQYGKGIEDRRLNDNIVYSYRFAPDITKGLYSSASLWNKFWRKAYQNTFFNEYILYCDIADFYNQIYHHAIENQLAESAFPNQEIKWIKNLLESTTAKVSRGVPVGPHPIHLVAEATLIPIDNSINAQGLNHIRYSDDILVFCHTLQEAKAALSIMASILDKQQRLMLQRHKTKIYTAMEFRSLCNTMVEDRPINSEEDMVLNLIKKYSTGDPYRIVFYNDISASDWKKLTDDIISHIINEYINKSEIDYIRLRWFYRRLSQIWHPGAFDISLSELPKLSPCFANICLYISSLQSIDKDKWKYIGSRLLELMDISEVSENEFFGLSILSLFTKNEHINHFSKLVRRYSSSAPYARREIILSAIKNLAFDWLREQKEDFQNMDPWQKMAYIYSISGLPREERRFFIDSFSFTKPFDIALSKWSKNRI